MESNKKEESWYKNNSKSWRIVSCGISNTIRGIYVRPLQHF